MRSETPWTKGRNPRVSGQYLVYTDADTFCIARFEKETRKWQCPHDPSDNCGFIVYWTKIPPLPKGL